MVVCEGIFLEADLEVNQVVRTGEGVGAWHPAGRFGTDAMGSEDRREKVCVDVQMQGILEIMVVGLVRRTSEGGCCWGLGVSECQWSRWLDDPLVARVGRRPVSFLAWVVVGNLPGLPFLSDDPKARPVTLLGTLLGVAGDKQSKLSPALVHFDIFRLLSMQVQTCLTDLLDEYVLLHVVAW